MAGPTSFPTIAQILEVFQERGHRRYGEHVTELQHALQCASMAQDAGEAPEIVGACLLHDFGHLLHDLGEDIAERGIDARHEHVGANRLAAVFVAEVVEPIRMHADAKRYLCWKE
ncbi:MAG: HD domain-containing protein, partial [Verrucomicrobiota bacterium]